MPNIEVHGAPKFFGVQSEIRTALQGATYAEDVVINTVPSIAEDVQGHSRPFLRIIFAENEPAGVYGDCLERIAPLNMDTEVVVIRKFIPKK